MSTIAIEYLRNR